MSSKKSSIEGGKLADEEGTMGDDEKTETTKRGSMA